MRSSNLTVSVGAGLMLLNTGVQISLPFVMGKVLDASSAASTLQAVTDKWWILGIVFVLGAAAGVGRAYIVSLSGERIVSRLRIQLFSKILSQDIAFFDRTRTGELVSRLSSDANIAGKALTINMANGLRSVSSAASGLAMMAFVSMKLTALMLAVLPTIAVAGGAYGRYVRRLARRTQDSLSDATKVAEERISLIRTVRAFTGEPREIARYSEQIQKVVSFAKREALVTGIFVGGVRSSPYYIAAI